MIIRKITLKAFNGRYSVVCEAEIFLKEKINFFYGKADAEVISIDIPGWPKGIFIRRSTATASTHNFKVAKNSSYFHQPFITFCKNNGFYCHMR